MARYAVSYLPYYPFIMLKQEELFLQLIQSYLGKNSSKLALVMMTRLPSWTVIGDTDTSFYEILQKDDCFLTHEEERFNRVASKLVSQGVTISGVEKTSNQNFDMSAERLSDFLWDKIITEYQCIKVIDAFEFKKLLYTAVKNFVCADLRLAKPAKEIPFLHSLLMRFGKDRAFSKEFSKHNDAKDESEQSRSKRQVEPFLGMALACLCQEIVLGILLRLAYEKPVARIALPYDDGNGTYLDGIEEWTATFIVTNEFKELLNKYFGKKNIELADMVQVNAQIHDSLNQKKHNRYHTTIPNTTRSIPSLDVLGGGERGLSSVFSLCHRYQCGATVIFEPGGEELRIKSIKIEPNENGFSYENKQPSVPSSSEAINSVNQSSTATEKMCLVSSSRGAAAQEGQPQQHVIKQVEKGAPRSPSLG